MAFFSNHFHLSFFFLLIITLLSSLQIHARDSQFFNKIPTNNHGTHIEKETKIVTSNKDQEPNFMPENENGYGVYGPNINSHEKESSKLPQASTSTTTNLEQSYKTTTTNNLIPDNKYLPKNYNPVAYVTIPQDNTDETNFMNGEFTSSNTYDNNNINDQYYNSDSTNNQYYRGDSTYDDNDINNNQYYNGGNTYNHYYRGDNTYDNDDNNNNQYYSSSSTYNDHYYNGGRDSSKAINSIEPSGGGDYYYNNNQLQHLSDSRLMDKGYTITSTTNNPTHTNNYPYKSGVKSYYYNNQEQSSNKYSYDANTEKYVRDPYENSREFANSYNSNNELSNYNNKFVNYENEEEFQDEEHLP